MVASSSFGSKSSQGQLPSSFASSVSTPSPLNLNSWMGPSFITLSPQKPSNSPAIQASSLVYSRSPKSGSDPDLYSSVSYEVHFPALPSSGQFPLDKQGRL